jgi:Domain of unknown function (DUF4136)
VVINRWISAVAVPGLLLLAIAAQAAKVDVRTDYDRKFDFRRVQTWAWDAAEAGDVKMARTAEDDPAPIKKWFGPTIVDAVAQELGKLGLKPAAVGGNPDVRFHYYLLVTVGTEIQTLGQFLPSVPEWGLQPFTPQATSFNIIQTGSLVLDAVSTELSRVVWRGIARTEIDEMRSDDARDVRIREVVHELARRFPRK